MRGGKHDHRFFDTWARRHGMRPVSRITDVEVNGKPVGDILLADSGEMISLAEYPPMQGQDHGMIFFFRTGFAIDRPGDKTWLASFNDYAPSAFLEYGSPEARLRKRCEEALVYATESLAQTYQVGLYAGPNRSLSLG